MARLNVASIIILFGVVAALAACAKNTLDVEVTSSLTTVCIKNAGIQDWENAKVRANDDFVLQMPDGSFVSERWLAGETKCETAYDFLHKGGSKTRLTDKCCFQSVTIETEVPIDGRWSGPS